ncbi:hypothetical protein GCM10022247_07000 [Allokutzneria multivorans]|uniref:Uncharacterized protein n=2 Tax=Allokutzneria multivorans TaxID=1142134 RepID=A0ABP7R166_9PSEU
MTAPLALRASQHARLVAPRHGDSLLCSSIGPSGEVITLWAAEDKTTAFVTVHAHGTTTTTQIAWRPVAFPSVQPLPDGKVLIVGARCQWRPDGPERNAVVYDANGSAVLEQTLGDGISHVLTTRQGEVWVGYFDEGVYGSCGWGDRDSAPPVGKHGLTRWSADLDLRWQYRADQWGSISSCYALNVHDDTAWAYYYTDFPVVRVDGDTVTGWHNDVSGASALAVGGSTVAFFGGYEPDQDKLVTAVQLENRLLVTGEHLVAQPDGTPLPASARVVGRGSELHFLVEDRWLRLSVEDLPRP